MHRIVVGIVTLAAAYWLGHAINAQFQALTERLQVTVGCQINTDC